MVVVVLRCHCGVTQSHASHPSHPIPVGGLYWGWGKLSQSGAALDAGFPCFPLDREWTQPPKLLSPLCPCWDPPKQEIDVK